MRIILSLFVGITIFSAANAQVAIKQGNNSVILVSEPCPDKVLRLIKPEFRDNFKQALVMISGKGFSACWAVASASSVAVIYEDNSAMELPMSEFKASPGI